jgi:cysteine-rich repeat protein
MPLDEDACSAKLAAPGILTSELPMRLFLPMRCCIAAAFVTLGIGTACNDAPQYEFPFDAFSLSDAASDGGADLGGVDEDAASDAASDASGDAGPDTAGDVPSSDSDDLDSSPGDGSVDDAESDGNDRICEPNLAVCEDGELVICDEAGASLTRTLCDDSEACVDVALGCACDAGACVPRLCAPGTGRCVGQAAQRCEDDGLAFGAPTSCEDGICQAGVCLPAGCEPGATTCAGDVALVCAADGRTRDEVDCTSAGLICVTDAGGDAGCDLPICAPRSRTCVAGDTAVAVCDARGATESIEPCPDATFCDAGRCEPLLCDPATSLFCDGSDVLRCIDGGRAVERVRTCEGECVAGSCGSECGDGAIDPGEQCDDGVNNGFGRCAGDCTLDAAAACAGTDETCVVVPRDGPPPAVTLEVTVTAETLDVGILMDVTGSMGGEISALERALTGVVVPALREDWPTLGVGLASYGDYPCGTFGSTGDEPFALQQRITTNELDVQQAIERLSASGGNDLPESLFEALYQVGSGRGRIEPNCANIPPFSAAGPGLPGVSDGTDGGIGFRPGTQRLVVAITDAPSQEKGQAADGITVYPFGATEDESTRALRASGVRVVGGASSESSDTRSDLRRLAFETGAVVPPCAWDGRRPAECAATQCCTGINGAGEFAIDGECPLVYTFSGTGLGLDRSLADGLTVAAEYTTYDVTIRGSEDSGDATCALIDVEAVRATTDDDACLGTPRVTGIRSDVTTDGFAGVRPGSVLTFRATLSAGCLAPSDTVREVPLTLETTTEDGFVLSQQPLRLLVPPSRTATATCGDGVLDPGEACDDGNRVNNDACSNACVAARCGDGVVQSGGASRTFTDPILPGGEGLCDDGASCPVGGCDVSERHTAPEHGICQSLGYSRAASADWGFGAAPSGAFVAASTFACFDYGCATQTAASPPCSSWEWLAELTCVDGPETCDDGAANADAPNRCRTDCSAPRCGDGIIDSGEGCDDGIANANLADACRSNCSAPRCGDGIVDSGEGCDDGNTTNGDGCSRTCSQEFEDPACVDRPLGSSLGVVATGTTTGAGDNYTPSCSELAADVVLAWSAPATGTYAFSTTGSSFDTALSLRRWSATSCSGEELACNDDVSASDTLSRVTRAMVAGERVLILIEGGGGSFFVDGEDGPYVLGITRL